jgi:hypothetical protein
VCLGLLLQGYWHGNVDGGRRCGLRWVGGRGALFAPPSDFADFGDDDVLGFGGVEGKGMPEYVVMVQVSVGVKNGAVSQRLFEEGPADEVGAGI